MEKRVLSFRVSEAEITALERLQQPEDISLSQTALRLLRGVLGVQPDTTVNAVDIQGIRDRVEFLEERLNSAITSRDELTDFINDIVDKRIQHLGDALSDHENRLLGIEQATVTPKTTTQEPTPALPHEELESAIAPKTTQENVVSPPAGKEMSAKKLKDVASSIQKTFRDRGIEISQPDITEKVLKMYPDPNCWFRRCSARDEVIWALEKDLDEKKLAYKTSFS